MKTSQVEMATDKSTPFLITNITGSLIKDVVSNVMYLYNHSCLKFLINGLRVRVSLAGRQGGSRGMHSGRDGGEQMR